jgi:purine-binding chemotaxis protein CheW
MRADSAPEYWLLCRAGDHLCALPLAQVHEIMRPLPIEAVAGAPPYVKGICLVRGEPVPVVHVGLLTGGRDTSFDRLIRVKVAGRVVAFAVDAVLGVHPVSTENLEDMPPLLRHAAADTVAAIGTLDRDLLYVLDNARIVPEGVFAMLDTAGARP